MESVVRLSGNKVNLCPFSMDAEAIDKYFKWENDESIAQFIGRNSCVMTINEIKEWFKERVSSQNRCVFNIRITATNELIGIIDIIWDAWNRSADINIIIGDKSCRNMGYGEAAMKMAVEFAFNQLNTHRVGLRVVADNLMAINCYEKVGFTHCGTYHDTAYYNGAYHDVLSYEMVREE